MIYRKAMLNILQQQKQ